jgi:hypothetical protein
MTKSVQLNERAPSITRVNDDGPGSDQFFPFITIAPGGRVDVCFQDRRYAPGNNLIFTTCASSTDYGSSFSNQQVTTDPFDASNNNFIPSNEPTSLPCLFEIPIIQENQTNPNG